jgi:HEPN domain-containing protein
MGPKARIYKRTYAPQLLSIAINDLQAARALNVDPIVRRETVLLMVQQSLEKALKCLLCAAGLPIPLSHELALLVERLGDAHQPPFSEELDDLMPYATIRRYEDGTFELTVDDITLAFEMADQVLAWSSEKVKSLV